ncbi:Transcriptional regulator, GnatR-like [Desulfonema limicola]|uniref:Transcriptional regulator, GnatR-like n=1 Tax=Desulfonema limicola TaxID=45656 RepID=A0A975GHI4_9BACT|nr:GntR family transcriptional regulator [Desulfonema limicola]QTA81510.1 Transcriptional regulator, GnatR-like [Desulfonema limicola]
MLNPQSPVPLYHQLADILMTEITAGEYLPGEKILPELKLAAEYQIGRPTVRQAIDVLVNKGFLIRKRGSGTFVCSPKQEVDLFSLDGTGTSFRKKGFDVKTRILKKICLKPVKKDKENPFAENKAYYFSRLILVEQSPVLIEDLYLHPMLFPGIEQIDLKDCSLSEIAQNRYYMKPLSGRQNFRIGYADKNRAGNLNISKSEPILIVKRFLNFSQADNAVYSELYCRTDQYVFSQTIGGLANG